MPIKRIVFSVVFILIIGGTIAAGGSLGSGSEDGWVTAMPNEVSGLKVLHITTPDTKECSVTPRVILQSSQASIEDYLNNTNSRAILNDVLNIQGVPQDATVSFVPPNATKEQITSSISGWNAKWQGRECSAAGGPMQLEDIEVDDTGQAKGFAVFRNIDVGYHTDDTAQRVIIDAPDSVGTSQDTWSAVLNNIVTDATYTNHNFLQNGIQFKDGDGDLVWTDYDHSLLPESYDNVDYVASNSYLFIITYTSDVWQLCVQRISPHDYECILSGNTQGDSMKYDINTSIFFENVNADEDWHSGFDDQIDVHNAELLVNGGTPQPWGSEYGENRYTRHNCTPVSYPVSGAMGSTTLVNGGEAYFDLDGIPLKCN